MNFTKKIMLVLSSILLFNLAMTAQVTFGSGHTPIQGALLDLKEDDVASGANSTKGLLLPRVQLESETTILPTAEGQEIIHTGLMVYHIGNPECAFGGMPKGVYLWESQKWIYLHSRDEDTEDGVDASIYIKTESTENLAGTEQVLEENKSYVLEGYVDDSNVTYQWSLNGVNLTPTPISNGDYIINKLTDANIGRYVCTMYDNCNGVIERYIDITIGQRDCSNFATSLKVYQPVNNELRPIVGKYEVEANKDIHLIHTVTGVPASTTQVTWTTNPIGHKLPDATGLIAGGLPEDRDVKYTMNVVSDYGCTTNDKSVTLKSSIPIDPACKIGDIFSTSGTDNGFVIRGGENYYIWLVPIGVTSPTINSSQPVKDWVGQSYTASGTTVGESTRREINVMVNNCPGKIILMAQGGFMPGCTGTGPSNIQGAYVYENTASSSKPPKYEWVSSFKESKAQTFYAFGSMRVGSTVSDPVKLSDGHIVLWYTADGPNNPKHTPLNYGSEGRNIGPTLSMPANTVARDHYVFMQVIQKDSGCSTIVGVQSVR